MSGRTVLIGGLLAQCLAFMIFVVIAILFDRKAQLLKGSELRRLRPLFIAFYVTAFLIIGRSLYRTIGANLKLSFKDFSLMLFLQNSQ